MELALWLVLILMLGGALVFWRWGSRSRRATELADARAEAQRWYERLGGQLMNLHGDQPAVRQALVDAGERYNAAGSQLEQAGTVRQFALARETALEGLTYIRAARTAMGIDPGPELPPLASARGVGQLTKEREVNVQGQTFRAGPQPGAATPYYYPGGHYQGRPVPAGWYSTPWWKTALGAGAGVLGGMLIADALFSPAFADPGYGYEAGYQEGFQDGFGDGQDYGDQGGNDYGGDQFAGDQGDWSGADYGTADYAGGDFGGGDFGGDFGGGDFGGGDW
ncbi:MULTISPECIES: hypothetical protein [Micromonospora]|uniref:DUF1542 domain-containing protein n=1 Tax=Micromonospora solifontis TaxID=2487138 RepID=A0ABX9WLG0_9ACTN|nr:MULTISPECIES: hypothetical protein [Micromonospora]NES14318.1 hypothetical protein [Micromonospora sp. PPF5-17B]NES35074.1 hypothetical protein [Micromonospora solifontis]NES57745.1 hypothetical protein [Micromonospora sp. PPF5-6]RNM01344.1 hypothetical protein EFE23_02665 [Micromonospora solifontis]